jgi:hypothetical protein
MVLASIPNFRGKTISQKTGGPKKDDLYRRREKQKVKKERETKIEDRQNESERKK